MSVRVNIRTEIQVEPKQVFEELISRDTAIVISSEEFPHVSIGTMQKGLCGVEMYKQGKGYQIRVCSFANRADLQLFIEVVEIMMNLTDSKAYFDDDEEDGIVNPHEELGGEWIEEQLEWSIRGNCAKVMYYGKAVVMEGLYLPICFGPHMAEEFGIDLSNPAIEDIERIQEYLTSIQWSFSDKVGTHVQYVFPHDFGGEDRVLKTSVILAKDGKVQPFDYVSHANLVTLMDDKRETVLIRMEDFRKVLPTSIFRPIDEYQFALAGELSYETFLGMLNTASLYAPEDPFLTPTFPGRGLDEEQNTFVLMWDPSESSWKMEGHVKSIPKLLTMCLNWSVYEYGMARKDDHFVMVRCGEGKTGVVMSGVFDSHPYPSEDWTGKGREVYYVDLKPNFIADPERATILTTERLDDSIGWFDWHGGHSGRFLNEDEEMKLEELLADYFKKMHNYVDRKAINGFYLPYDVDA